MQFPIQDHYIHTSRHRKTTIRSKWTFFCGSSYVCNDLEWETAYKQAPKKGFKQNISQERERKRKLHNVQFLGESNGFSTTKIVTPVRESYIISSLHMADHYQCLSRKNLNILYDRHGPNPDFLILRTFEHLNLNT